MSEQTPHIEAIHYLRVFPWIRLFRAFWIAVDIRKLLLAVAALLAIAAGDLLFEQLPFAASALSETEMLSKQSERWPWQKPLGYDWSQTPTRSQWADMLRATESPWQTAYRLGMNWQLVLRPLEIVLAPGVELFQAQASWSRLAYSTTRLLWALCVWAVFGGAIGRMSAVQLARDQNLGVRQALYFSGRHFFAYLSAPLLPLVGVGVLWAFCALGGLIGRIPVAGEIFVGILWGLGLIFGFLMALVLIGVAAGWPLMFATINVEGTDGFDGLSRAYNYVYERPWHCVWYTVVSMSFGSFVIFFVWLIGRLVVYLTAWAVAWGMGYEATAALFVDAPSIITVTGDLPAIALPLTPSGDLATAVRNHTTQGSWGTLLVGGWLRGVASLVVAFVYTYFWTSTTIMYFLLRREVDSNDFDEVHLENEEEPDNLLPLVGTAAVGTAAMPISPVPPAADLSKSSSAATPSATALPAPAAPAVPPETAEKGTQDGEARP